MKIGVVGAGMAGLACAERLVTGGHAVILLDKGRAVGGRMSTRRTATHLGEAAFDYGAQYFTVRDAGFRARADDWIFQGCLASWRVAGSDAYVGVPAMNSPLRAMSDGLAVQWGAKVTGLSPCRQGWRVSIESAPSIEVDVAIVAVPAEQAAALTAGLSPAFATRAEATRTAPCWTVMSAFDATLPTAIDCWASRDDGVLSWAARNGSKPGRTGPESWVIHASPEWSNIHLEASADEVAPALLAALAERLGVEVPQPIIARAHRWRYARSGAEGSGSLWDPKRRLGLCGDWLIGPRVEAAWMSGNALAERIEASI